MAKKERKLIISIAIILTGRDRGKFRVNIRESDKGPFIRYGEVYSAVELNSDLWKAVGDK